MVKIKINKVKALREALNKKQSEIADFLNISQSTYCKKERQQKFSDYEKLMLTSYFKQSFPSETLESIFF
jgi:DNA-binding helix-turn-helix protein